MNRYHSDDIRAARTMGVRTCVNGVSWPPEKLDEKLKSENMQKEQSSMFMSYFESNRGRQM